MESRWRMPAIFNPTRFGLALALVAAALLRFWALPQGVPFSVQVDEPEVLLRAVRMMKTSDFHPHFFDYPSLYMYMQAAVALLRFVAGAMQGQWASLSQAPPEAFYVWGRALTAALGTATIWGVYRAGMRLGQRKALLAAGMFAVMPLHVRESHFVLTDVPMTFFVILTLVLSLRARERATTWAFACAGAAAGLAAGTKYNGVLAVLLPIIAGLSTPSVRPSRLVALFWIGMAMVLTFLIVAPYTVLDLPTFLNQFARLTGEYRAPSLVGEPVWLIYLKHLRNALRWPGSVIVIAGFALGIYRVAAGPDRGLWLLLTIFPIVYFRFISNQSIFYGRYLLPLLPFLSILGAAAVVKIVDLVRAAGTPPIVRNAVSIALALITIALPGYTSITFNANAAKEWTTEQAYNWIIKELPPGTVITFESRQVLLPATYKATYLPHLRMHPMEHYVTSGVQYLVASSAIHGPYFDLPNNGPAKYPAEYAEYMNIFRQSQEVARFSPSSDHPGPELRIFRIAPRTEQ